jgi:hypothetical protein
LYFDVRLDFSAPFLPNFTNEARGVRRAAGYKIRLGRKPVLF